jgi:tetratricopeptide (TPR) repeat protein
MKQQQIFILLLLLCSSFCSCNKDAFLDKIPNTNLVIPSTLPDLQALLDESERMNVSPYMSLLTAEEFYMEDDFYDFILPVYKNCYTWKKEVYEGQRGILDWNTPYTQVFYANVVLEKLKEIPVTASNEREWKRVKGCALFFRGNAFYNLVSTFSVAYDAATAAKDAGIVLRFASDFNVKEGRSSVQQSYTQILADLEEAAPLLQTTVETVARNRPSRPAAFALLARVSLSMRRYEQAAVYADECLKIYHELIDYNTLTAGTFPFPLTSPEVIWQGKTVANEFSILSGVVTPSVVILPELYTLYSANDLRRSFYFRTGSFGTININGSYNRSILPFTGLAVDEVYLIRAETYARADKKDEALADLNTLLEKRYSNASTYIPVTAATPGEALVLVLQERRKELVFRGLRFTDIRRFNKEGKAITLTRTVGGVTYTLPPNDRRYALPIPDEEVLLNGIAQNQR